MKFTEEQIEVLLKLKELDNVAENYLNTVPSPFKELVADNELVNKKDKSINLLIDSYFKENAEWAYWFLYEWEPKDIEQVWIDGIGYVLNTEEAVCKLFMSDVF